MKSLLRLEFWKSAFSLMRIRTRSPDACLLIRGGRGLGDALLAFGVAHQMRKQGRLPIIATRFKELAENNPDVIAHVDLAAALTVGRTLFSKRYVTLDYPQPATAHLGIEMSRRAGLEHVEEFSPKLFLSDKEIHWGASIARDHICVQVESGSTWTPNKQWPRERVRELIKLLSLKAPLILVGASREDEFPGTKDYRGRLTIRQTGALLRSATLFVGMEGGLMHLAKAVSCKSVIIFGGYIAPWQSGYVENVNLFTELECSPCWKKDNCPFERKCLTEISVDMVLRGAIELMASAGPGPSLTGDSPSTPPSCAQGESVMDRHT